MWLWSSSLLLVYISSVLGQGNGGSIVAQGLMECYNDSAIPGVLTANGRPPATINMLVEFIRKLEDANPTMSAQQLSLQLMHRYRQDGIIRTDRNIDSIYGIPYAARRLENNRFRVLLRKLLPNIQQSLEVGNLNNMQKCSLHYMISSTIDERIRDNEASECSRSSRYTSRIMRKRRSDIELVNREGPDLATVTVATNGSQCPIELGVVFSQYGTVKVGDVLAGIAAGLNQQNINSNVDNRFASTITGELCEAALYQASSSVQLGAAGGWNSSINPRYYFLHNNNFLQATDAEIRGSLDGLFIALKLSSWTQVFSDIKISQILDMYYAPNQRGVFDPSFRACNRNILYTELTSSDTMTNQLSGFMPILYMAGVSSGSLTNSSFQIFTKAGIRAFESYLPQINTADLSCPSDSTSVSRIATDLLVYIDHGWSYSGVQSILSYILNNIDVGRYGSRYRIFSASTGNVNNILFYNSTNITFYLSDFYERYNSTVHQKVNSGFDYIQVFQSIENLGYDKLNNNTYEGGESTIVLLIPRTGMTDDQKNFVSQRKQVINQYLPDLNFLVLGSGSSDDYSTIVTNPSKDVVIWQDITDEETLKNYGQKVVDNIKDIGRAVVNPLCSSSFNGSASTFSLTQYVEPTGVNYYRVSPNYFSSGGSTRNLKIREEGFGSINFCYSNDNSKPENQSGNCRTLSSSEQAVDLSDYCSGSVSSCNPFYFSVFGLSSTPRCSDTLCRFPDEIKYTITMENVGCASSSAVRIVSSVIVAILFVMLRF